MHSVDYKYNNPGFYTEVAGSEWLIDEWHGGFGLVKAGLEELWLAEVGLGGW